MYLINTEQREHLKLLRENSPDGIFENKRNDFVEITFTNLYLLFVDLFQLQSKYVS